MEKKQQSTTSKFLESLSTAEKKQFKQELKDLALSEMVLAAMAQDDVSVRKLAKLAQVSPSVIQAIRSGSKDDFTIKSIFKVLNGLGYSILLEKNGQTIPLDISHIIRDRT